MTSEPRGARRVDGDGHLGYVMPIGGVAAYRDQVSVVGDDRLGVHVGMAAPINSLDVHAYARHGPHSTPRSKTSGPDSRAVLTARPARSLLDVAAQHAPEADGARRLW